MHFHLFFGTFFSLAFSNIENSEKLDVINIAVIDNEEFKNNDMFKETFKILSDKENENRLFDTKYTSEKEAEKLLQNDEITGYMLFREDNTSKVVVKESGINETILKYVAEEIMQSADMMENLSKEEIEKEIIKGNYNLDYDRIYKNTLKMIQDEEANIEDISSKNLSYTMIEFYTLIAMACLYGGILGMVAINQNLANMSSNGKRVATAPVPKGKMILSSVIASYIIQLIGITILFLYTIFVLKVDYGNNLPLIIVLALCGCLAGLSLGVTIASVFRVNENTKTGIIITITMLGSFLSGMMGITMKYIVDKNIPIINKINPASMITDGFYSLYYYDTLDRFYSNVVGLLVFSLIMIALSYFSLRRQRYDSI